MDQTNEQAQAVEQEEQATDEITLDFEDDAEETVSIPKSQFNKMKRKALAYDSSSKPKQINHSVEQKPYDILNDDVADLILNGYSKDETRFILANGGRKALDDKDSFVAVAIASKREQRRTEQAASETSNNGYSVPGGKTITEQQMREMSLEELERNLPHA